MGLMVLESGKPDSDRVLVIARTVSTLWNKYGGVDNGFYIKIGEREVSQCCERGEAILAKFSCSKCNPGPFKRVAALVVLSRLFPFFGLTSSPKVGTRVQWMARLSAMLIPSALRSLRVNISTVENPDKTPTWVSLNKWKGFPSPHYKVDFLAWLAWMDKLDNVQLSRISGFDQESEETIRDARLARMILVTALMLEACYYCGETLNMTPSKTDIRGKCTSFLLGQEDLNALTYDQFLIDNYDAAQLKG